MREATKRGALGASPSAKGATFTTGAVTLTHLTEGEVACLERVKNALAAYPGWFSLLLEALPATGAAYSTMPVVREVLTKWEQRGREVSSWVLELISRGVQVPTLTNRITIAFIEQVRAVGWHDDTSFAAYCLPLLEKQKLLEGDFTDLLMTSEELEEQQQQWEAYSLLERLLALRACHQAVTPEAGLQIGLSFTAEVKQAFPKGLSLALWHHLLEEESQKLAHLSLPASWWVPLLQEEVEDHHRQPSCDKSDNLLALPTVTPTPPPSPPSVITKMRNLFLRGTAHSRLGGTAHARCRDQ